MKTMVVLFDTQRSELGFIPRELEMTLFFLTKMKGGLWEFPKVMISSTIATFWGRDGAGNPLFWGHCYN